MYVCRQCGHIGQARIKHWEMSEWRQGHDGSSYLHEWSGSTAYCKECDAHVKTKHEWTIDDYRNKHGARNFLIILLYFGIILCIFTLITDYMPYQWLFDLLCFGSITSWVSLVAYLQIVAPEKYARQIDEEDE